MNANTGGLIRFFTAGWLLATTASCSGTGGGGEGTDPSEHLCPETATECIAVNIREIGVYGYHGVICVPNGDSWSADLSGWPEYSVHCTNEGSAVDFQISLSEGTAGQYALSGTLHFANANEDWAQKVFGTCSPLDTRLECEFRWTAQVGPNEEILEPYQIVRGVAYFPPVEPPESPGSIASRPSP